jgi:tRNA(adenine34) deaminase
LSEDADLRVWIWFIEMAAAIDGRDPLQSDIDIAMMRRCIHLSATSTRLGELPFAALICKGGEVIVESTNRVVQSADVVHHAELVAISEAQKILGRADLSGCTLYSTVEPCAMCAFAVRETGIGRVAFSISSPIMGGLSKWNVLRDTELSHALPEVFGPVPEVIVGLLRQEAEDVWQAWNPVFWAVIKNRGYLGDAAALADSVHLDAIPESRGFLRHLFTLHRHRPT